MAQKTQAQIDTERAEKRKKRLAAEASAAVGTESEAMGPFTGNSPKFPTEPTVAPVKPTVAGDTTQATAESPTDTPTDSPFDEKDRAALLVEAELAKAKKFQGEIGLGGENRPETIDEVVKQQLSEQERKRQESAKRVKRLNALEDAEFAASEKQAGFAVSGVESQFAQGREGPMSANNADISQQFQERTDQRLTAAKGRIIIAQDARAANLVALQKAQDDNNEGLARRIQGNIALAEQEIQQAENEAAKLAAEATTNAFGILAKLPAGAFTELAVGDLAATLGIDIGTASVIKSLDSAEAALESTSPTFLLDKANLAIKTAELKTAGMTSTQKEFLFAQKLPPEERAEFLDFASKNPNFQSIKVGDQVWAFNPKTSETELVIGSPSSSGVQPTGQSATAEIGGRQVTLDSGALLTFQQGYASLQKELGDVPFGSIKTFSQRDIDVQKEIYGKGRNVSELMESGMSPEESELYSKPDINQTSWVHWSKSKHLDGLAIDFWFDGKDIDYINKVDKTMNKFGWSRPIPGKDPGHFIFNGEKVDTQLNAKIRAFVQSRSGVRDKDARLQLEKDIQSEIESGRATSPSEAKRNLGIVSEEDREVKKRISDDLKIIKKDNQEIIRNVDNIQELVNIDGGIGDTAAITAFLKTIDPGSVARESEVAGVENARGAIEGVALFFENLKAGDRLGPIQKEKLKATADILGRLSNEKLFEQLIQGKQELLDRGVEPTSISQFQINKLEREIGKERAHLIRRENDIFSEGGAEPFIGPLPAPMMTKYGFGQIDNATLIDE